MQLHQLKPAHPNKLSKRVGRGGKRGKTAGRGTKGQKSRAGHRMRPELRDIIKKLPKNRGYKNKAFATRAIPVNLAALEIAFAAGESVSAETLIAKKLVKRAGGKVPPIKILGSGILTKKLAFMGLVMSDSAKKAIEKVGGTVE